MIADFVESEKWQNALGDGFRIEARIVVDQTDPDALLLPAGTLFRQGNQWHVYLVRDGIARLQPVTVGLSNQTHAEITEGIDEGDQLVLHPTDQVRDGVAVRQNE